MSYNFDGVDDWIGNITSAPVSTYQVTLACWFNADTTGGHLINICNSTGEDSFRLAAQATTVRLASVDNGTSVNLDSTATYTTGSWNHICAVVSSATDRRLYLNGNVVDSTTSSNPTGFTRLHIGSRRNNSITDNFFDGKIAEVGIWSNNLAYDEVISLAKGVSCTLVRTTSLAFYAPLIRNIVDLSKNNLALTNNGGATVADHTRVYL